MREHVVSEHIREEDLSECRLGGVRRILLIGEEANLYAEVVRVGGGVQEIGAETPDCAGVVDAEPAGHAGVPDHGINGLATAEEELSQGFDEGEFEEIERDAFEADFGVVQWLHVFVGTAIFGATCVVLAKGAEEVLGECAQGVLRFTAAAGGEEEVEGLGWGTGVEEFVDYAAADCVAQTAVSC